jgi:hypothetical protein
MFRLREMAGELAPTIGRVIGSEFRLVTHVLEQTVTCVGDVHHVLCPVQLDMFVAQQFIYRTFVPQRFHINLEG